MKNTVERTNRVARAVTTQAIHDHIYVKGKTLTARAIVAEYGLSFGVYRYKKRPPMDAALQMVRNHLNRAYLEGRVSRLTTGGGIATVYGPPDLALNAEGWEAVGA